MWCLLQLVWGCLEQFSTLNEASIPYPLDCDGVDAGVCPVSGAGGCADGCATGRRVPHHLLSRAFRVDGVSAVLHQLHCIDPISRQREGVDAEGGEVGCDCDWG